MCQDFCRAVLGTLAVIASLWPATNALAQDERSPRTTALDRSPGQPWSQGVSTADQDSADELFAEGNKLLMDEVYALAAEKYRKALEHWNHPAIHFNLSLVLKEREDWVGVYRALQQAMKHGVPGLRDQVFFKRAQTMFASAGEKVAILTIVCTEEDVRVTLGGKQVFTSPGSYEAVVFPGEYVVHGTEKGREVTEHEVSLAAGARERVDVRTFVWEEQKRYPRSRWWEGSLAIGGGVALAGGVALGLLAQSGFDDFDEKFDDMCTDEVVGVGCMDEEVSFLGELHSSEDLRLAAYVAGGLGGAALVGSLVMWALNRPDVQKQKVWSRGERLTRSLDIAPVLNQGHVGVSARLHF